MKRRQQQGFTLTEMGILLLVIVATLGIAVPVLIIEQRRSQMEVAMQEIRLLPDAILLWIRDADPIANTPHHGFAGPGKIPVMSALPAPVKEFSDLQVALTRSSLAGVTSRRGGWKGPYVTSVAVDPWGQAFVFLGLGTEDPHQWFLTAGPNGILETTTNDTSLGGDDLGTRLR